MTESRKKILKIMSNYSSKFDLKYFIANVNVILKTTQNKPVLEVVNEGEVGAEGQRSGGAEGDGAR